MVYLTCACGKAFDHSLERPFGARTPVTDFPCRVRVFSTVLGPQALTAAVPRNENYVLGLCLLNGGFFVEGQARRIIRPHKGDSIPGSPSPTLYPASKSQVRGPGAPSSVSRSSGGKSLREARKRGSQASRKPFREGRPAPFLCPLWPQGHVPCTGLPHEGREPPPSSCPHRGRGPSRQEIEGTRCFDIGQDPHRGVCLSGASSNEEPP